MKKDKVKSIPIIDVARGYIDVDSHGKALCPFHNDHIPSLSFNIKTNRFRCFGCGKSGDSIDFVMEMEHKSYSEAVDTIASKFGITKSDTHKNYTSKANNNKFRKHQSDTNPHTDSNQTRNLLNSTSQASNIDIYNYLAKTLQLTDTGRKYMLSRGFSSHTLSAFGIKSIDDPQMVLDRLRSKYTDLQLSEAGIVSNSMLVFWKPCIVIPYYDENGDVIYFQSRNYEDGRGKYFKLHKEQEFYYRNLESDTIYIFESALDAMSFYQLTGIDSFIAVGGTSGFDRDKIKSFLYKRKLSDKSLVFVPDNDEAGRNAVAKLFHKGFTKIIDVAELATSLGVQSDVKDFNDILTRLPRYKTGIHTSNIVIDKLLPPPETTRVFWEKNKKGAVSIIWDDLCSFLECNGFYMYRDMDNEIIYIHISGKIVRKVSIIDMLLFVTQYLEDPPRDVVEHLDSDGLRPKNVRDSLKRVASRLFTKKSLVLHCIELDFIEDTMEKSHFVFKNGVVEVTADDIRLVKWPDVEKYVWEPISNRYKHNFPEEEPTYLIEFKEFIKDVTSESGDIVDIRSDSLRELDLNGYKDENVWVLDSDEDALDQRHCNLTMNTDICFVRKKVNRWRYERALQTAIGYMMCGFRDESDPSVIVLTDEMYDAEDGELMGGTGKSVIGHAISETVESVVIDDHIVRAKSRFAFQNVTRSTQAIVIDEVSSKFDIKSLFIHTSTGIKVEEKFQKSFFIPIKEAPRFIIFTNVGVKKNGASYKRRIKEYALSAYYTTEYAPKSKYGHIFFSGWDEKQWSGFYYYMMQCVQEYLSNGILEERVESLINNQIKIDTAPEFVEYIEQCMDKENGSGTISVNLPFEIPELYRDFTENYCRGTWMRDGLTKAKFTLWLKKYADYSGWSYKKKRTSVNGIPTRTFTFIDNEEEYVSG